jgi:hypothetical protein
MVGGSLRVRRLLPPPKTGLHDIPVAEILLKVALNTITLTVTQIFATAKG